MWMCISDWYNLQAVAIKSVLPKSAIRHNDDSFTESIPGSMRLLNCEIYQRGRVSRVTDTELVLLMAHLIRPPGSIHDVGRVRRNK